MNLNKKAKMSFVRQNTQSFIKLRLEADCMNVIPTVVFLTAVIKTLLNICHNLLNAQKTRKGIKCMYRYQLTSADAF